MKMMKLYAYFAHNLGDDLMVRILLERYPEVRFYADSWNAESGIFGAYPNFESRELLQRRYGRRNHILNLLTLYIRKHFYLNALAESREARCRGSVYIGGSLYMEGATVEREEGKLKNGPLFVIGANFGPNDHAAGFRAYFARCGGVTFRDRASVAVFPGLENVRYAPDVVLNLKAAPGESQGTVLISVMDLQSPDYERWMAELCDLCVAQGKIPVLMSFCEKQGDERAAERILAMAGRRDAVRTLYYRGDASPILEAYRHADRVIATRFHAMILAWCFEKPVFAVAYSEKTAHVAADLGFGGWCRPADLNGISPAEALNRCALPEGLADYKRAAAGQFAQLDVFLEGNYAESQRHRPGVPGGKLS